jgi:Zn-dependent peptidase ImmA (M78 family)
VGERRRHLSRDQIDAEAEKVALHFDPRAFARTTSPLYEVMNGLKEKYRVSFFFDRDLGTSERGRKILGRFDFTSRRISIDGILPYDSPRFRWSLSHEIGHLVLHRKLDRKLISLDTPALIDTRIQLRFVRTAARSELEWVEWQANKFAAAMLLPRPIVHTALVAVQHELDIPRPGSIYLDDQRHNLTAYLLTLRLLSERLNVSRTMLRIRLLDLGILIDGRPFHRDPIQEGLRALFSESPVEIESNERHADVFRTTRISEIAAYVSPSH